MNEEGKEIERLKQFTAESQDSVLYADGPRNGTQSTVCRRLPQGGQSCLKLQFASTKMFEELQKLNYFCILPQDTARTEMECRR